MLLKVGAHLGPYEIVSALGAGGMGEVYKAMDTRLDRAVAIKVLSSQPAADAEQRQRFEREARAIASLNHPHICVLHDIGRQDDLDFLVMEYLEGASLACLITAGPVPAEGVVRYGLQIAEALEAAHEQRVLHGDIKPSNMIVTKTGIKLVDFSLARRVAHASPTDVTRLRTSLPDPGLLGGTLPYMAPELLQGKPGGPASDLWALGVVLHEMAAGTLPFTGHTGFELSAAILRGDPQSLPPWIPQGLRAIVERCLARELDRRFDRASQVRAALEAVLGDPAIAPPPPAAAHNLPLQLTRFIGREEEIAKVRRLVASEQLVTLTGAGGAGKTRLALQVARELVPEFTHGVWLIELGPLADPDLVPHTVAATLGLRDDHGRPLIQAVADFLRPRTMLLILDNCEHVISACATLVSRLLRVCPRVRILATSREALGVPGEQPWRVPSLSLPESGTVLSANALTASDAVALFVDRAQAVSPTFALTFESARAVTHICQRLDGIPLAIELAAARLKVLSVGQIGARLDDRFRLLTGGSRTAVPRQQTLRAAIDWSYSLLSDAERRVLCRLSVFSGGWTLEAAEQVCADAAVRDGDVLDLLSHLVDKSLVVVEGDLMEPRRYRLLETVRQYSRDRLLESGDAGAVRDRHFEFFHRFAREAEPELRGSNQIAWLDRLQAEHDNLRTALEWGREGSRGAAAIDLAGAVWWLWLKRGYVSEGRQYFERLLAATTGSPAPAAESLLKAIIGAGHMAYFQGDLRSAEQCFERSLVLAREAGNSAIVAFSLFLLGLVAVERGDHQRAGALAEESLVLSRRTADGWLMSAARHVQGLAQFEAGEYDRAVAAFDESLVLARDVGDKWMLAIMLSDAAAAAERSGQYESARNLSREGLLLSHELGDCRGVAWCLEVLASVTGSEGQPMRAARLLGAADALLVGTGGSLLPFFRPVHERAVAGARETLGEETFALAWADGRRMISNEIFAYALEEHGAHS